MTLSPKTSKKTIEKEFSVKLRVMDERSLCRLITGAPLPDLDNGESGDGACSDK